MRTATVFTLIAVSVGATTAPLSPQEKSSGSTLIREKDGTVMVYVPAGMFLMGSSDGQLDAAMRECRRMHTGERNCNRSSYLQEQPAHLVTLPAFWIDRTEVTNERFCAFLNARGNQPENGTPWLEPGAGSRGVVYGKIELVGGTFRPQEGFEHHPVIEVSWYGAQAYCSWVGGRLPTEAEWEYAARGPKGLVYPWGNDFDGTRLNYRDSSFAFEDFERDAAFNDGSPLWTRVGRYPEGASWCGALDMAGNVWEWVSDWWSADSYARAATGDPTGPDTGTLKIGRGGSWYDPRWHVRAACRKALTPSSHRIHWIGFRCVIPESR
ncbi:MAG: formylglycine-generating enzyme family protein [Bacteroidota bacterium]